MEDRVELLQGPALSSLSNLLEVEILLCRRNHCVLVTLLLQGGITDTVDFAFIDADKANYSGYIQLCHKLLKPGGLLAVDNTLYRASLFAPSGALFVTMHQNRYVATAATFCFFTRPMLQYLKSHPGCYSINTTECSLSYATITI